MKENKLLVYWSNKENTLKVYYPLGQGTKSDGSFLFCDIFTKKHIEELKQRGYDLKTLKFSIEIDINNPNIKEKFPTYYLVNTLKSKLGLKNLYENSKNLYLYTKGFGFKLSKTEDIYKIKCVDILGFKNWKENNLIYNREFEFKDLNKVIEDIQKLFDENSGIYKTLPHIYLGYFKDDIMSKEKDINK